MATRFVFWGGGEEGLGTPPTAIKVNKISAGFRWNMALKTNGEVWGWGSNTTGNLGNNTTDFTSSPVMVVGNHSFVSIQTEDLSAYALKANGEEWAWGNNSTFGELGDNSVSRRSSPVSVVGEHTFSYLGVGYTHTLALKSNGEAWAWGDAGYGKLGNQNTADNKSSPISVVGNHSFISIVGGGDHTAALKANGEVWTWGNNTQGQLGDLTTTHKSSPISVVGGHAFVAISIGADHSIGLKTNGEVWTWGLNNFGQLGIQSIAGKSSPVSVVGNHSFVAVAAGYYHSVALKANGEVWTWGNNDYGYLGINSVALKSSPVLVVGNHSFIAISAGYTHTMALKENGEVWCWGDNTTGALGDNTNTDRSSPVLVVGLA